MKEFDDVLIRSFLYLKNPFLDGGQIISRLNPVWMDEAIRKSDGKIKEKFSSNSDLIVSQHNLKLIALMINEDSFIHNVFWNSFAEAWGEYVDLYLPFNTSELVSILKKFNGSDSPPSSEIERQERKVLYNKLISFIGANGLLKKSSHIGIETPKELLPGHGTVAALNYDFFKSSIIKESHETLLHGFLAIQGISPLAGFGRDEMMSENSDLSASDLDFLKRNYLVHEVQEETSSRVTYLPEFNDYEDINNQLGKRNACLELHTEQLEIIIGKVKKLLNRLEKMQQPASADKEYKPVSTLKSYLRHNFEKLAYLTGSNSDFLYSIYLGNKFFYKDILGSKVFDENVEDKNNVDLQLELMLETNRTDLDKIFMNSIVYLLDALRARRDVCRFLLTRDIAGKGFAENYKISLVALTNLAELSTLKTLKNELTRKSSGLIKVREESMDFFVDSKTNLKKDGNNKRIWIDMESAYKWLKNPKRTSTWKEVVLAPYLNKSLDYLDLTVLGNDFLKALNENNKFSRTEKSSIKSALHLNKKKGSKVSKALLDSFYEESESFFSQRN